MSTWRNKGGKAKAAFHASAPLGFACFMTYDDQAVQMFFSFRFMQLCFLDVKDRNRKLHFANGDLLGNCRKQQSDAQNAPKLQRCQINRIL